MSSYNNTPEAVHYTVSLLSIALVFETCTINVETPFNVLVFGVASFRKVKTLH